MKKSLILLVCVALFASCGNKKKETVVETETITSESSVETPSGHENAANSLDFEGTYKGTLPTANGDGMQVTITLDKDNKYTKEVLYVGKEKTPTKTTGTYEWDASNSIITLKGEEKPNQYFVGENTLTQLDVNGNKITGDIADQYILKK